MAHGSAFLAARIGSAIHREPLVRHSFLSCPASSPSLRFSVAAVPRAHRERRGPRAYHGAACVAGFPALPVWPT